VVQARTGSSRLPGKVLADIAGRPMLRFQLERLTGVRCDHLVIATSERPPDDAVAAIAEEVGAQVLRGSEEDVLSRFVAVIERFDPQTVVRLTGDCPLSDPAIVNAVLDLHHARGADYTSNVHPRSFPKGLDVEVASAASLVTANNESTDPDDHEHVTPFLYSRPERFRLANLDSGLDLGNVWWTVDTKDDLARIRSIVQRLDDPIGAPWIEILGAARRADLL
jgi:spore coat polysaccharide biosynthesis protein SpsF